MSREFPKCDCENPKDADWEVIRGPDMGVFHCKKCGAQGIVFIK